LTPFGNLAARVSRISRSGIPGFSRRRRLSSARSTGSVVAVQYSIGFGSSFAITP